MLLLTFVFAVLNIFLGFALAVYLGHGPAGIYEALDVFGVKHAPPIIAPAAPTVSPTPVASPATEPNQPVDAVVEKTSQPENSEVNKQDDETLILSYNSVLKKNCFEINRIDSKLREYQGHCDKDTIESCLVELREDCDAFLTEQREAARICNNFLSELDQSDSFSNKLATINLELMAQIESTLNNFQYMDYFSDLEEGNRRLLEEIRNLYVVRYKLRDNQEIAFSHIVRNKNCFDKIDKQLLIDTNTDLCNRMGLGAALSSLWRDGQHQTRQMTAVMFDIDKFAAINDQFGPAVGDLLIRQFSDFLKSNITGLDMAVRYSGHQFVAILFDVDPQEALKKADLWRQSLEKTVFMHNHKAISITATGAVSVLDPDDTHIAFLERLENLNIQAKKSNPGRLLFWNGKETLPVDLPEADVPEKEIVI